MTNSPQIDYLQLPSLLFAPIWFDTCTENPEITESVETVSLGLCGLRKPHIKRNMEPWSIDDLQWFKDNSTRRFRLRLRFVEEIDHNFFHIMQDNELPTCVVVHQPALDIRVRLPVWSSFEDLDDKNTRLVFKRAAVQLVNLSFSTQMSLTC